MPDKIVRLSGHVTLETVTGLYAEGVPIKDGDAGVVVDFRDVELVDSSAISLMLVWLRTAQKNKVQLSFANVPDNLSSLAGLYGVADMLALKEASASGSLA